MKAFLEKLVFSLLLSVCASWAESTSMPDPWYRAEVLRQVKWGLCTYYFNQEKYPDEKQGLSALLKATIDTDAGKASAIAVSGNNAKRFQGMFDQEFRYTRKGANALVRWAGPDRKFGTADDLEMSFKGSKEFAQDNMCKFTEEDGNISVVFEPDFLGWEKVKSTTEKSGVKR